MVGENWRLGSGSTLLLNLRRHRSVASSYSKALRVLVVGHHTLTYINICMLLWLHLQLFKESSRGKINKNKCKKK